MEASEHSGTAQLQCLECKTIIEVTNISNDVRNKFATNTERKAYCTRCNADRYCKVTGGMFCTSVTSTKISLYERTLSKLKSLIPDKDDYYICFKCNACKYKTVHNVLKKFQDVYFDGYTHDIYCRRCRRERTFVAGKSFILSRLIPNFDAPYHLGLLLSITSASIGVAALISIFLGL